ncbi:transcriptional regulator [Rhodobacterales bacterium 59_46_T64]|nr:transcriptional regulator [Rhodobacterales bacterium 59_46_T64]
MSMSTLTGSRIRERRLMLGVRQTQLAASVNISASYLNLIEHNRRRIGGKLLRDLAAALGVEQALLSEGAEAALIATLREAAATPLGAAAERDRTDEFAGRFPGWAQLVMGAHRRIGELEHIVETLTDRLAHDPHLAASMHEVLSMVTAIRSTAGILADTREIEPEWRDRFHRNLNEDAVRLAEGAQSLVAYLDRAEGDEARASSPQDEIEAFLRAHDFHFSALEAPGDPQATISMLIDAGNFASASPRVMMRALLERYAADAQRMPLGAVLAEVAAVPQIDPAGMARRFDVDLGTAMRRLAMLAPDHLPVPLGLVICDASGSTTFRKPIEGFPLPRFGGACPLWPLYSALGRPMAALHMQVRQSGRGAGQFDTYAIAQPIGPQQFDAPMLVEAHMLIVPERTAQTDVPTTDAGQVEGVRQIGVTCRICPRKDCIGRREPSIMSEEF